MDTASSKLTHQFERPLNFYREHYNTVISTLMIILLVSLLMSCIVILQLSTRPLPDFTAIANNGRQLTLVPHTEPNLASSTITKWARKAAVTAYTFDFVNYNQQLNIASQYFTPNGWLDYQNSIAPLIADVRQKQIFVSGVVTAAPVISNQGELAGHGYVWRLQIPFLVTYQSTESTTTQKYTVIMAITKVPTSVNPAGIGIDQFVMK